MIWKAIVGLTLALSLGVRADETFSGSADAQDVAQSERKNAAKKYEPTPKTEKSVDRSPSSLGASFEAADRPASEWGLRLDLSGGLAALSTNNVKDKAARDSSHIDRNIYFGLNGDFQWGRYLGVGLDTYLSTGTTATAPVVDNVSGVIDNRSRKISQNGVALELLGRYPLEYFGDVWNFRGGPGYGILSVSQTNPAITTSATESKIKASAPYFTAGLEVKPKVFTHISLNADAAFSFGGSTTSTVTTAAGATATDLDSPRFVRYRLSATYALAPQYSLGLQYIRRELRGTSSTATARLVEGTDQFLTVFSVLL